MLGRLGRIGDLEVRLDVPLDREVPHPDRAHARPEPVRPARVVGLRTRSRAASRSCRSSPSAGGRGRGPSRRTRAGVARGSLYSANGLPEPGLARSHVEEPPASPVGVDLAAIGLEAHRPASPPIARAPPARRPDTARTGQRSQQDGDQPIVTAAIAPLKMRSTRLGPLDEREDALPRPAAAATAARATVPTATAGGPSSSSTRGGSSRPSRSRPTVSSCHRESHRSPHRRRRDPLGCGPPVRRAAIARPLPAASSSNRTSRRPTDSAQTSDPAAREVVVADLVVEEHAAPAVRPSRCPRSAPAGAR